MRTINLWLGLGCLLTLAGATALPGAAPGKTTDELPEVKVLRQQFHSELTGLRAELLEQGLEFQRWKINQLERELQRLEPDLRRLEETEQELRRHLADIEQNLEPSSSSEGRALGEQAGMKAELSNRQLNTVQKKQQLLLEQITELQRQLQHEQKREQELRNKLRQVKATNAEEVVR